MLLIDILPLSKASFTVALLNNDTKVYFSPVRGSIYMIEHSNSNMAAITDSQYVLLVNILFKNSTLLIIILKSFCDITCYYIDIKQRVFIIILIDGNNLPHWS